MPLIKSSSPGAFKQNVRTLMGEVGKSPHVQSRQQALAIAYATRRRKRALGGKLTPGESMPHASMKSPFHVGPILSAVPGRTDHHAISVPAGAYVFPADHVNSLGQGNSVAGLAKLHARFPTSHMPHGPGPPTPKMAGLGSSAGGARGGLGDPVDIAAAGGEFIVQPHHVLKIGKGSLKRGHEALDREVLEQRKRHIKTLRKLPPPAKS